MFGRAKPTESEALGRWGESQACKYLRKKGFTLITRNFRCRTGEIDLIMMDSEGALVFVEVKTRRSEGFVAAEEVITSAKRRRLKSAARCFLATYRPQDRPLRFDVVVIAGEQKGTSLHIRHYRNAFH